MIKHLEIVNMKRKSDYADWRDDAIRFFKADTGAHGVCEVITFRSNGPVGTRSSFAFYREELEREGLVPYMERVFFCPLCEAVADEAELEALGICEKCHGECHS